MAPRSLSTSPRHPSPHAFLSRGLPPGHSWSHSCGPRGGGLTSHRIFVQIPERPFVFTDTIGVAQRQYTSLSFDIFPGASSGSTQVLLLAVRSRVEGMAGCNGAMGAENSFTWPRRWRAGVRRRRYDGGVPERFLCLDDGAVHTLRLQHHHHHLLPGRLPRFPIHCKPDAWSSPPAAAVTWLFLLGHYSWAGCAP